MVPKKKRKYNSKSRQEQSKETRKKILFAAKELFSINGVQKTTIDQIAKKANVASPTIYSLFKSKSGIVSELGQTFVFGDKYISLVKKSLAQADPIDSLRLAPTITVAIFEMEMKQTAFLWDRSLFSEELQMLIENLENQRFERQTFIIERLYQDKKLIEGMSVQEGREILWAMTGREVFKKLVKEKGWSHSKYIEWLEKVLKSQLVRPTQD